MRIFLGLLLATGNILALLLFIGVLPTMPEITKKPNYFWAVKDSDGNTLVEGITTNGDSVDVKVKRKTSNETLQFKLSKLPDGTLVISEVKQGETK